MSIVESASSRQGDIVFLACLVRTLMEISPNDKSCTKKFCLVSRKPVVK